MNTVLAQECIRYNKLTSTVKFSLRELGKALKGLAVMSKDLDAVGTGIATNKLPELWEGKSYPSLKPLSSYVTDLIDRLAFIGGWVANGAPPVYWVSGFFFPQVRARAGGDSSRRAECGRALIRNEPPSPTPHPTPMVFLSAGVFHGDDAELRAVEGAPDRHPAGAPSTSPPLCRARVGADLLMPASAPAPTVLPPPL